MPDGKPENRFAFNEEFKDKVSTSHTLFSHHLYCDKWFEINLKHSSALTNFKR